MDMQLPMTFEDMPSDGAAPPHEAQALACVLPYAEDAYIALPIHAGVELVEQPRIVPVPGMPFFCDGLVSWQGRWLPLIDLQAYLGKEGRAAPTQPCSHVLIVAYQASPAQPIEYGAFNAPWLVRMVQVSNSQQCPLPTDHSQFHLPAISCFQYQGRAVPVLDPSRMFTRPD